MSSLNSFAPIERINEHKIMEIFAMVIINLDLNDSPVKKIFCFSKAYGFCFTLDNAISIMENLHLNIQLSKTITTIAYNIKPDLAKMLLSKFYLGKLLHCPSDRTLSTLLPNVPLQPSAKGLAIVQDFCKNIGMNNASLPPILFTNYNSMNVIKLDRDSITDDIVYSDYLIHVLFQKLLGESPNLWTCYNDPDKFQNKLEDEYMDQDHFSNAARKSDISPFSVITNNEQQKSIPIVISGSSISPYHHRYFTNPELDSHIQYYVSSKGVRFQDKIVFDNGKELLIKNCATGKSICQWLCDCCDIFTIGQAIEIGNLFLKSKLIDPVPFLPSKSNSHHFSNRRDYYYTISKIGRQISLWSNHKKSTNSKVSNLKGEIGSEIDNWIDAFITHSDDESENKQILTLANTLSDPGLRYLFRQHLESDFCVENLDAYLRLKQYEKKIVILGKLLKNIPNGNKDVPDEHIILLTGDCVSIAFNIFVTYLSSDAPFLVNLDYHLRNKIATILTNPKNLPDIVNGYLKTPIKTNFDINVDFTDVNSTSLELSKNEHIATTFRETCEDTISQLDLSESPIVNKRPELHLLINNDDPVSGHIGNKVFDSKHICQSANEISKSLNTLARVTSTYEEIKRQLFNMMERDSFPKFLESDICKKVNLKIKIKTEHSNKTSVL